MYVALIYLNWIIFLTAPSVRALKIHIHVHGLLIEVMNTAYLNAIPHVSQIVRFVIYVTTKYGWVRMLLFVVNFMNFSAISRLPEGGVYPSRTVITN